MTSLEVIDTDAFLDMPPTCQLLYFHLNARADDDGFVANPKRIMRDIGSQADDLKVLIGKKFIIAFEDGVCVIKHWRINNFIRKDIYKETKYLNWKQTLLIRPNGAYTQTDDGKAIPIPKGHFNLESVDEALTKRQLSIGKVSIDKIRVLPENSGDTVSSLKEKNDKDYEHFLIWYKYYPRKVGKPNAYKAWKKIKPDTELKRKMVTMVLEHCKSKQWQSPEFIPYPATYLNQRRWEDELPMADEE